MAQEETNLKAACKTAIHCLKQFKRKDNPEAYAEAQLLLGLIYNQNGETKKAIEYYNKIKRKDNPEAYTKAQLGLGLISYISRISNNKLYQNE